MNDPNIQKSDFPMFRPPKTPKTLVGLSIPVQFVGVTQNPWEEFLERIKKVRVKKVIFSYFGLYFAIPKDVGQYYIKNVTVLKKQTGVEMLLQNFKFIAEETSLVDPIICEGVIKKFILLYISIIMVLYISIIISSSGSSGRSSSSSCINEKVYI